MMKKGLIMFILAIVMLSACSNSEEQQGKKASTKQLIIPKADHFEHLYIQGLDEKGVASEQTKLTNSDIVTVKNIIKLVDRMIVMRPKYEADVQSIKQMDEQGSYILAFGNTADFRGKTYTIYMLKDGTFYFQDILGSKDIAYVSVEAHKDIYEDIKKTLNIQF